jgi:hypothetical protein
MVGSPLLKSFSMLLDFDNSSGFFHLEPDSEPTRLEAIMRSLREKGKAITELWLTPESANS